MKLHVKTHLETTLPGQTNRIDYGHEEKPVQISQKIEPSNLEQMTSSISKTGTVEWGGTTRMTHRFTPAYPDTTQSPLEGGITDFQHISKLYTLHTTIGKIT